MEELPTEEAVRVKDLLLEDEAKRDRNKFIYTYDIIVKHWIVPFSIWPLPNEDAICVINGEIDYADLSCEDQNEAEKGMLFKDIRQVVSEHFTNKVMLCEAIDYEVCLKDKCQMFEPAGSKPGGQVGVCREYKIAFRKE